MVDSGIVTGGNPISLDRLGILHQATELQPGVAADAGIGRAGGGILIREIITRIRSFTKKAHPF